MFVVIEGIDGSGKSTQIEKVAYGLRNSLSGPIDVETVKFPIYDSPTGKIIAKMLHGGLESRDACLIFQALMATNRMEFAYNLSFQDKIVLADRYTLSGLVYGLAQGLDFNWLSAINHALPSPTMTLFLDVSPSVSFARRPMRNDPLESDRQFMQKIYDLYREHLPLGAVIVDGTQSEEQVTSEIVDRILLVNQSLTYRL